MAAPAVPGQDAAKQAFFPISEISTYHSNWTIRARVTSKNQLRALQRAGGGAGVGNSQVFDVYLLDESGVEIRANFFSPAAEQFFPKLEAGKCYAFSRGRVRIANRQYNRCAHRYELIFEKDSVIEEVADEAGIETVVFAVTDLRAVGTRPLPCTFDLCGIITSFRAPFSFTSKEGKELVKREIVIADDTATSMSVTLWGERAKLPDSSFENKVVVCLKGVVVKEWQGGRSGSLMESGNLAFGPKTADAQRVHQWWSKFGPSTPLTSISLGQDGMVDLATLRTRALPCTVELVGIVAAFKPTFSFTSKEGKELVKREIAVADDSGSSLLVTLWGDRAKQDDSAFANSPLIWLKGVVVKEWNGGRSGSLLENGTLVFQPTIAEAQRVQAWWSGGGSSQTLHSLSQEGGGGGMRGATGKACTLAEMRQASEQVTSTQGEVFSITCRLALVQMRKQGESQPLWYMACQEIKQGGTLPCNKRVDNSGYCAACDRIGKAAVRMNLRCRFSDCTDSAWLTTFHEAAQRVLDMSADDVKALETDHGREAVEAALKAKYFQQPLQITVRAKLDTYQGEMRPNITCIDARPVSRQLHAQVMQREIEEMLAIQDRDNASNGGA